MKNNQDNQREALLYAYLAGIMDGEGTIRINVSPPPKQHSNWSMKYCAAVSVGMTDKRIIEMFCKMFGSKLRIDRVSVPNRKIMYRWGTSGNHVVPAILRKLLPYLVVKKEHAKLVIKFAEESKTTGFRRNKKLPIRQLQWREALCQKVRNLNH